MVNESDTFVATDFEGTLFDGVVWEGMRDYLLAHGHEQAYRRFFLRQLPALILYRLGIGDKRAFAERWLLRFLQLFAGFSAEAFSDMSEWVVSQLLWPNLRPQVVAELQQHGRNGHTILIVSGLFQPVLDAFVQRFSADGLPVRGLGTPVRFDNGVFSGQIEGRLNVRQRKVEGLQAAVAGGRLAVAYGDTRSDIPMPSLADDPVAVYPDTELRQTALDRRWRILGQRA